MSNHDNDPTRRNEENAPEPGDGAPGPASGADEPLVPEEQFEPEDGPDGRDDPEDPCAPEADDRDEDDPLPEHAFSPMAEMVASHIRNARAKAEKAKYMELVPNLRDPLAPVAPAAELLEAQLAQCVDLIHQLGFIAGHPKCPDDERYHLLGNITSLLESSATVGKVIGRLRNGPEETRHRVIVEKGKKRGKGVRKS